MEKITLQHRELGSLNQIAELLMSEMRKEVKRNGHSDLTLNLEGAAKGIYEILEINNIEEREEVSGTYKHWWYTVDRGMGIKCDKCDAYANIQYDNNFSEIEKTENCPVSDEEFEMQL